jgi:hypothetical protein
MKRILLALILLFSKTIISQNSNNFIYLFSGESITSDKIEYISKSFSSSYFIVNGKEFKSGDVQFYQNKDGFFANTKKLTFSGSSSFSEREITGKINLFNKEFVTNSTIMGGNGMVMGSTGPNSTISYYYNKGEFGELKKSNYSNLKIDLNENLESISHLNKFKSVKLRETLLYIVGGAVMTVGVASLINKTSNVPEDVTPKTGGSFVIIGIGFGTLITNYLTTINKHKHIKKAIEVYNE